MKRLCLIAATATLAACSAPPPARIVYVQQPVTAVAPPAGAPAFVTRTVPSPPVENVLSAPPAPLAPLPPPVIIDIDPPRIQPPPVRIAWAPPPILVESPPPQPWPDAVWIGGYWVWQGDWVWARGHWSRPPEYGYAWIHPYYENRGGDVVFVNGFWAAPGVVFVPPPPRLYIPIAVVSVAVVRGPRCVGPEGVFVPAPPGSRAGLIVPAPLGTAPAVVAAAPPIIHAGMRVQVDNSVRNVVNNTVDARTYNRVDQRVGMNQVNNVSNVNNVNNVTVNRVTIVAPPGTTAGGQAVRLSVPAQAHMAAAMAAHREMAQASHPSAAVSAAAPAPALPQAHGFAAVTGGPAPAPARMPEAPAREAARPAMPIAADRQADQGPELRAVRESRLREQAKQTAHAIPAPREAMPVPAPAALRPQSAQMLVRPAAPVAAGQSAPALHGAVMPAQHGTPGQHPAGERRAEGAAPRPAQLPHAGPQGSHPAGYPAQHQGERHGEHQGERQAERR